MLAAEAHALVQKLFNGKGKSGTDSIPGKTRPQVEVAAVLTINLIAERPSVKDDAGPNFGTLWRTANFTTTTRDG